MSCTTDFPERLTLTPMTKLLIISFRLAALLVLAMVLVFPAFKGVWIGYVPVLGGAALWWTARCYGSKWTAWLAHWPVAGYGVVLMAIPLVIQLALILWFQSEPRYDGLFVYREAVTLVETGQMNPLTYYAPGQVWYFAAFFYLFGVSPLVAQLCQLPLALGIVLISYRLALRWSGDSGGAGLGRARAAVLCVAFYPGLLLYVLVTPYYYYLYTLMILLWVWAWHRLMTPEATGSPQGWRCNILTIVVGGLAAGFGALTKATLLVAPLQMLCGLWLADTSDNRRRLLGWGGMTLVMGITLLPWVMRNQQVFGEPVLVNTAGPLVFYSANNPYTDGLYSAIPDEVALETPQDMLAHRAYCREQAWSFIRSHPGRFVQLIGLKLLHTWGTETTFVELINRQGTRIGVLDPAMRFGVQVGWSALVMAWAAQAWVHLRQRRRWTNCEIILAILVLSKFLIYSLYEGGARHHMPVVPLLWLWGFLKDEG